VAARKCPNCLTVVPAGRVAAYSNDLVCPGCSRALEISPVSRNLAMFLGLAAGFLVWRWAARGGSGQEILGWVAGILFGYLALSIVAALFLMYSADLQLRAWTPPPVATALHGTKTSH